MNPLLCCRRALTAPTGLRIPARVGQAGTQSCVVAWDPVAGANKYQLQRKSEATGWDPPLWSWEGSATQCTVPNLYCGAAPAPFTVRVRAGNEAGWGPWSLEVTLQATQICITAPAKPGAPYKVSEVCVGSGYADLTIGWSPVAGATKYRVYHPTEGLKGETSGTQFTVRIYTYPPSGAYYTLAVEACNAAGCSGQGPSTQFFVKCEVPPATPTGLRMTGCTVQSATSCSCTFSWNAVSGATRYEVEHGGSIIYSGSGTSFTKTGLYPGASYTIRVRACNAAGCSAWSSSVTFTTPKPPVPATPTGLSGSVSCAGSGYARFTLYWNSVPYAVNYQIRHPEKGVIGQVTGTSFSYTDYSPYYKTGAYRTFYVKACNQAGCSGEASRQFYAKCP